MRIVRPVSEFTKQLSRQIEFWQEFHKFNGIQKSQARFQMTWRDRYPILNERTANTHFDSHYIYHPAWAARILAEIGPSKHVDISSSLYFCTMVSAFIPVDFYDYRPAELNLQNLQSKHADLTALPFADNSIESLSCMHVVEHLGLGRYGDPIDPLGDLKAIAELKRVLAKNGTLLFATPVGKPTVRFNAHRIYSFEQIASYFPDFCLKQFALVTDEGEFILDASPGLANQQKYGCGCWWFVK